MASEGWTIDDARSSSYTTAKFYCVIDCSASSSDDPRIQTQADAIAYLWSGYDEGPIILSDLTNSG